MVFGVKQKKKILSTYSPSCVLPEKEKPKVVSKSIKICVALNYQRLKSYFFF